MFDELNVGHIKNVFDLRLFSDYLDIKAIRDLTKTLILRNTCDYPVSKR